MANHLVHSLVDVLNSLPFSCFVMARCVLRSIRQLAKLSRDPWGGFMESVSIPDASQKHWDSPQLQEEGTPAVLQDPKKKGCSLKAEECGSLGYMRIYEEEESLEETQQLCREVP